MTALTRVARLRDLLLGVLALTLLAAGLTVAYLAYNRTLVPHRDVTLRTEVVGNALQVGSDVKFHGVPIGIVSKIEATSDGADLTLALDPDSLPKLPANVVARLLPKTMFGERYVALVVPQLRSSEALSAGDVIHEDASAEAAELQQVFDEMLPVLRALQPEKLSAMLGEFATMLQGNGAELGDSMVAWSAYMKKMNPKVPQMMEDFERLAEVADSWKIAAPDLLDALATMTTSTRTLVEERDNLKDVYASVIGSANTTRGWISDNSQTIIVLARESKAALRATAPYASQFPCLFRAVAKMKPRMEQALGVGTDEPGLHSVLTVMPARSKYLAGKDDLTYTQGTPGPRCPYVTGEVGTTPAKRTSTDDDGGVWPSVEIAPEPSGSDGADGADGVPDTDDPPQISPPPGTNAQKYVSALVGLGDVNSPAENQLIAELIAPTQGMAPSEYPEWSSLLLGPTLRNTKVVLK